MWNLRRPHWTKTSTVWCCLLLRVAAFVASENTGRPCTSYVVERVAPQGARYMGAQRYQAEDCYGRATVALTRAFEHTYIVSPLDMAGMIGMAQALGVNHYGHCILKNQYIQYHGPAAHPTDKIAIMEWGLVAPFISQDKLPLAIAMIVTINGTQA